ncbi:putative quinol monooxygenase [Vannielia litorea]|uniref:Antibiotic biosynthesis monooxygenase n=1 Tax=Vannielia litorea TaxID=1217970 RepID=A0A1N6FBL0_9RHOB|nr:antibiotic biosynthesis monooxygenase [Vannielia litorea]SIN92586.1 Antibiotic biosynthesis monooxygenase [Vannielia litorea]
MGQIRVEGRLICETEAQAEIARTHLPEHIRLSRAEPGNLRFDITQGDDPLVWHLSEAFESAEAFAAHQARTKDSTWGEVSAGIIRDFTVTEDEA